MKASNIREYKVCSNQSYFFDTNVWMFLFAPLAGTSQYKQRMYSRLLRDIITCRSSIFISSLVVAEYVNAVLKLGYKHWKEANQYIDSEVNYKIDYRPSIAYRESLIDVKCQLKEIMKVAKYYPDDFHKVNIDSLFQSMDNNCDFCDSYIIDLCKNHDLRLVTDDKDISSMEHQLIVITA